MKGLGIAGFVLSSAGIALSFLGYAYWGVVASIVGLILSAVAARKLKKRGERRGLAVAGVIISVVSLVISLVMSVIALIAVAGFLKDILAQFGVQV